MGFHLETKIQREEAYVNSHAASVDRTINSREYRLGTASYAESGHVPHDKFWSSLAKQEERNPSKFFAHNPQYVGFFTSPARIGELPQGNVIFDVMKDRDINQHSTFAAHHPFYVGLVDRDLRIEAESTTALGDRPILPLMSSALGSPAWPMIFASPPALGTPSDLSDTIVEVATPSSPGPASQGTVPEPASFLMVIIGLIAAVGLCRFYKA